MKVEKEKGFLSHLSHVVRHAAELQEKHSPNACNERGGVDERVQTMYVPREDSFVELIEQSGGLSFRRGKLM